MSSLNPFDNTKFVLDPDEIFLTS